MAALAAERYLTEHGLVQDLRSQLVEIDFDDPTYV
jgi:hypothetical protein